MSNVRGLCIEPHWIKSMY